jgi:hypothetical protein
MEQLQMPGADEPVLGEPAKDEVNEPKAEGEPVDPMKALMEDAKK